MAVSWPLAGRAEELSLISGLTRRRDGPAGVVLAGAAGVGKTRLAREVLVAAQQRGALVRWAVGTASAQVLPLGAFAATLGVIGPDPARLVRQASDALLAGAGPGGVVIGVDDAHLLDGLSATLVHQLVLRRAAPVVLTLRTGEGAPDAVTALWKDGHLTRLELQPLSEDENAALVEARLGGPLDSVAARRLWSATRGNPLYLRQLVEGELEAGRLHQVARVWRWSGTPTLSPGLVELLSARIGQLPDAQRDVVEVLALAEPLGIPLLVGLTDAAAVEQVEARGLVEVHPDGRRLQARLAHPLYGEVQRAQLGRLHARRVRGRIAQALAATGGRRAGDTLDAFGARIVPAAEASARVLAHPRCSPTGAQLATWALAVAGGGLGRLEGISERVRWIDARADAFEIGLHQAAVIGSSWVRAMLLAGLLDEPDHVSRRYRKQCQDTPGIGDVVTSAMRGAVAACRGQVDIAARWFRQSLAGGADTGLATFTLLVDLPGALGMAGEASLARQALDELSAAHDQRFVYLAPELLLSRAWVAAAEGSVSEAVRLAHQAAELAVSQDQPAVEVLALHTAVCFGDRTVAGRLAVLATQVDGPRAHAAAAHTRHDQRGSAQAATARAHRLAQACQGARTPGLAALAAPLALTRREREIVTLAAGGLSNRQIADRLVVSVRTVEGHLYRACTKLGVSDRTELAAVLHGD